MIRITARVAGFRRAGIAHAAHPVEYPVDRFTPEQLAALKAEPMLVVEQIEAGPTPTPTPTPVAGKVEDKAKGVKPPETKAPEVKA